MLVRQRESEACDHSLAVSTTRPGYGNRDGPGKRCSSIRGTNTTCAESPFAECIVITRTRAGKTPDAGIGYQAALASATRAWLARSPATFAARSGRCLIVAAISSST